MKKVIISSISYKNPSQIQESLLPLLCLTTGYSGCPQALNKVSYTLQLRIGDSDYWARKWGGMLAHKGFSSLLLSLEMNKSLFLPIHLKDFAVDNGSMLLQKAHNLLLSDVLWECGQMDYLCRGTAIPVVFSSIAIKPVETWIAVLVCVSTLGYARMLGKVYL